MKKFSSIESFRHVVKTVQLYHERIGMAGKEPTMHFTGTVKLHGTNAGVRRSKSGKLQPQSKERIIGVTDDNYGFAKFIDAIPNKALNKLFDNVGGGQDTTIYGEWIGKGIQNGCAIHQLDKQWVIFGARVNEEYIANEKGWRFDKYNIYNILDVEDYRITVDFKKLEESVAQIESLTLMVESRCPWAYSFGGILGIGEGIVWKCDERPEDNDLWFKSKGSKHSGKDKSRKKIATIDPQKVESIEQCIDIILTEGRLKQGLEFLADRNLEVEMRNMGKYLKWVGQDIQKEEMDTIEANGLEWKDVTKFITQKAKAFYMGEVNKF